MNIYIILWIILVPIASGVNDPSTDGKRTFFNEFKQKFSPIYQQNELEHEYRFRVFSENLVKIEQLNAQYGGKFGITKFADRTEEEINTMFFGPEIFNKIGVNSHNIQSYTQSNQKRDEIPSNVNWCDAGMCNTPRNQGSCGSCWAFSAVTAIESQLSFHEYGKPILSIQQLLDCDREAGDGCGGGFPYLVYKGTKEYCSETSYSYIDGTCGENCPAHPCVDDNCVIGAQVFESDEFTAFGDNIKNYLYHNGPISACLHSSNILPFYTGGVFDDPTCTGQPNMAPNHAITVVGYGYDETDGDFLWVQNSWGDDWGINGYFKIKLDNACGIGGDGGYGIGLTVRPLVTSSGWTCPKNYFDANDGCDCNCGEIDPDCRDPTQDIIGCQEGEICNAIGVCSPAVPLEWTCDVSFYNAQDGCDCDCGIYDTDCDTNNVNPFGCSGTLDQPMLCHTDGTCAYVVPSEWTCDDTWYMDGECDCDCGILEADCHENDPWNCEITEICNRTGQCQEPPYEWSCSKYYYNTNDGCDCNCGAYDPDCDYDWVIYGCSDPREWCNTQGQCEIPVPGTWTCDIAFYYANDGCDCGCGALDPDCENTTDIYNCPDPFISNPEARCSITGECLYVPPEWTCDPSYYGNADDCDCECGAHDPDCDWMNTIWNCAPEQICTYDGYCIDYPPEWICLWRKYGDSQVCNCECGTYDPDCDNDQLPSTCLAPGECTANGICDVPGWTCESWFYGADDGCDCECGVVDPDCSNDAYIYGCVEGETCDNQGHCDTDKSNSSSSYTLSVPSEISLEESVIILSSETTSPTTSTNGGRSTKIFISFILIVIGL